jgi:HK97 family phage prohead protease
MKGIILKPEIISKGVTVINAIKDIDLKGRKLATYYASFEHGEDSDSDIAMPGMTLNSIKQRGPLSAKPRIKNFINHETHRPFGRPIEMGEDARGPWGVAEIGDWNDAIDTLKQVDFGVITEASYGLQTIRRDPADRRKQLEVVVWEWSNLTAWGAQSNTSIFYNGKSLTTEDEIAHLQKKMVALEKFCRNSTATDECIENLLIEMKYLNQRVIDLLTTTAAGNPPTDQKGEGTTDTPGRQEDYSELLNNLKSIKFN